MSDKQRQRELRELLGRRRIARDMTRRIQATSGAQGLNRSAVSTVPPPGGWDTQLRRLDLRVGRALAHLGGESDQPLTRVLGSEPAGGPGGERWRHDYEELLDFKASRPGVGDEPPAVSKLPVPGAVLIPLHASPHLGLEL